METSTVPSGMRKFSVRDSETQEKKNLKSTALGNIQAYYISILISEEKCEVFMSCYTSRDVCVCVL